MPWLPDQKVELEHDLKELQKLGLIDDKEFKKRAKTIGGVMSSNLDCVKNSLKQSKIFNAGGNSPSQ